jgi:hypothetical protein
MHNQIVDFKENEDIFSVWFVIISVVGSILFVLICCLEIRQPQNQSRLSLELGIPLLLLQQD